MTDDPLDDIPDFLRLTPEQRREAWERNPPSKPQIMIAGPEAMSAIREELEANRKAKSKTRIAIMKQKKALDAIPKSQRRWDPRKNQWVKA